jgi:hypothetical protein
MCPRYVCSNLVVYGVGCGVHIQHAVCVALLNSFSFTPECTQQQDSTAGACRGCSRERRSPANRAYLIHAANGSGDPRNQVKDNPHHRRPIITLILRGVK